MMRKIYKYTSVFFLWLAALTLCGHLLLPHDHHIDGSFSGQNENCPASNSESGHHSGFPVHCHAFNDLVTERFRVFQILPDNQYNLNAFISSSEKIAFDLSVYCVRIIDLQKPFINSYALELFLLRAPPSQA
jgi:hypothetical protein